MVESVLCVWGRFGTATSACSSSARRQERVPASAISRVSALDWTGTLVLNPIGFALVGPLAAIIGVSATLIGAGTLTAIATLAVIAVPSVRNLRTGDVVQ